MEILLFDKVCLYDSVKDEITLYGQYNTKFHTVLIEDISLNLVFCNRNNDFYIKIKGKISNIKNIKFVITENKSIILENIQLYFPFENCDLDLNSTSAIISTLCKDYSHRLDEWIKYNLDLGFSGIVIFNNDKNKSNGLHEPLEYYTNELTTEEICNKYKGKVFVIDMPYSTLPGKIWTDIQRITLCIGVNAFRNKCRNIALIDADEFIYIPKDPSMKIEIFLQNYSTVTMKSNILTNKNNDDILNNNILKLAKYIGEDKYTKTILSTDKITNDEFIITPHHHHSQKVMDKNEIIHYHCWMNNRYKYNESMVYIDILRS